MLVSTCEQLRARRLYQSMGCVECRRAGRSEVRRYLRTMVNCPVTPIRLVRSATDRCRRSMKHECPKNGVQFMVKDSKKYAATGGWGYAQFNDGKALDDSMMQTCYPCHQAVKSRDFVFTRYAP